MGLGVIGDIADARELWATVTVGVTPPSPEGERGAVRASPWVVRVGDFDFVSILRIA